MASYADLLTASENGALRDRVKVACIVAASVVRAEDPATANHALRLVWARAAFAQPDEEAQRMLWALLAEFRAVPLGAITGATDAQLQSAVNDAVSLFAV